MDPITTPDSSTDISSVRIFLPHESTLVYICETGTVFHALYTEVGCPRNVVPQDDVGIQLELLGSTKLVQCSRCLRYCEAWETGMAGPFGQDA